MVFFLRKFFPVMSFDDYFGNSPKCIFNNVLMSNLMILILLFVKLPKISVYFIVLPIIGVLLFINNVYICYKFRRYLNPGKSRVGLISNVLICWIIVYAVLMPHNHPGVLDDYMILSISIGFYINRYTQVVNCPSFCKDFPYIKQIYGAQPVFSGKTTSRKIAEKIATELRIEMLNKLKPLLKNYEFEPEPYEARLDFYKDQLEVVRTSYADLLAVELDDCIKNKLKTLLKPYQFNVKPESEHNFKDLLPEESKSDLSDAPKAKLRRSILKKQPSRYKSSLNI